MSHYVDIKTQITDEECLVAALGRIETKQWTPDKIEIHKEAIHLYGYRNDIRSQKANVVIRRRYIGNASNDIGFLKNADGTYTSIISEYDQRLLGPTWLQRLTTYYGIEKAKKEFRAKGIKYTEAIDNKGRIQLRAQIVGKGIYE